jgi:transaldolase
MKAPDLSRLRIKIFADGADLPSMLKLAANPLIKGFTTNPTLMRAAGVTDYRSFARRVIAEIPKHPISFEVVADDFKEMEREAREIASWGENVYVKIPVTDTTGELSWSVIKRLSHDKIKLNITAVFTQIQVGKVANLLESDVPAIVSVFAGRIADTGRDPAIRIRGALALLKDKPKAEVLWASPREVLNVFQADAIGCHIITVTPNMLEKLALIGKDLTEYSRETVLMFHNDAARAGLKVA